jgi:hypothetical protein
MRTSTPTVSLVSSLVAVALTIAPFHGAVAAAVAPDTAEAHTAEAPTAEPEPTEPTEPPAELTPEEAAAARDAGIETNITTAKTKAADAKAKVEAAGAAKEAEEVETALNEADAALAESKTAIADAKSGIEESKAALAESKAVLEESKAALATKKKKEKPAAEAAIAEAEASVVAAETSITEAEAAVAEAEAAVTEVETAITTAREEADAKAKAEAEAAAKPTTPSFIPDADDRPPEPRIANKPAKGKGLMIAGGTIAGVGLGLTIAFSLMTRKCSFDGPLQCSLQNQDDLLIPMGAATLLAGTMVLGVGVGYFFRYKRWERWSPEDDKKTALVPTADRNGAGLAWVGRF